MKKPLILALAATATLLAAGAAQAGSNVYWSIGISAPPVGTVISNAPVYAPEPVYYPAPVYAPPPVIYQPAPRVIYQPPVVVHRPVPIVYPGWGRHPGHGNGHWDRDRDGIPNRYDRIDNRYYYGDRDRDGVPNYRDRHDNRDWGDRDRDGIPNHRDRHDNRKHRHDH